MADAQRLAVSNIAWEPVEDEAVADVLRREGVTGVEIAPTKWRERPFEASAAETTAYRQHWENHGLCVVSLQALLFGRPDLQLFGSDAVRAALADYLRRAIDFAAAVGAHALVFGSPKNRIRGDLSMTHAMEKAATFFHHVAEHAHATGAAICIEANPVEYGCDFITTTIEAVELCRSVGHPGVRVNVDLGGITMTGESPSNAVTEAGALIGHVHASEPNLGEIGAAADHAAAAAALRDVRYDKWVSIEMRATGDNIEAVERAVRRTRAAYSRR